MKTYESTLAFLHSRRLCRLSASFSQLTVYSKRTSIFISLLSIISLLSSVAAVQQQRIPSSSSSITFTNGSSAIFSTVRRRILPTTPISVSTTTDKIENLPQNESRNIAHLVIIIIICSLMSIITIVGNLVVILAVCLVRKLQTASNILIVSLAVSDVLFGLFIMPLAMVLEITNNRWILGSIMCDIWTTTDILLSASSILNFLVISIDRYCITNHPFKYAPMRKVKLLSLMIAGVWILSAFVSLPPILGWGRPSNSLPICQLNPKLEYQLFSTMLYFYIPLIIILILYANIYRTAQTAMDNRSSVQMSQLINHNNSSTNFGQTNVTTPLAQQQSNDNSCSAPQLLLRVPNQKAIRTLGVILGTYIICWLPFMLFAIIKPLHEYITRLTSSPRQLNVPAWVDPVLLWSAYSSSMLKPLIYYKFNR